MEESVRSGIPGDLWLRYGSGRPFGVAGVDPLFLAQLPSER